jgi:nucleoside-triphosphatase THEP1
MRTLKVAHVKPQERSIQTLGRPGVRPFFVDREAERLRLRQAIAARESLFISGPAGIGKTALVLNLLESLEGTGCGCVYLSGVHGLRKMLEGMLTRLFESGNKTLLSESRASGSFRQPFRLWLRTQSASRLKGTLNRAAIKADFQVFLDHSTPLTRAAAKVLKELVQMRGTPVHLLARGEDEAAEIREVYWSGRHRMTIPPLPRPAAAQLIEHCIQAHGLEKFNLETFREEILRLSGAVPGAIVGMCALAAEPRHIFGSKVKTRLVLIDFLTRGSGLKHRGSEKRNLPVIATGLRRSGKRELGI